MGHPLIRRMLQEISERLLTGGAISHLDDIYWLTKTELEMLITQLDNSVAAYLLQNLFYGLFPALFKCDLARIRIFPFFLQKCFYGFKGWRKHLLWCGICKIKFIRSTAKLFEIGINSPFPLYPHLLRNFRRQNGGLEIFCYLYCRIAFQIEQIMEGIQTVFYAACIYFTRIQLILPAASISETLFTKFFQGAARRAGITDTSVLLLGFDTIALQSEKNLWDLSEWARKNNTLGFYLKSNPAIKIAEDFKSSILPAE